MSGTISNLCNSLSACWNTRNTVTDTEFNTQRDTAPPETSTVGSEHEKTAGETHLEIDTDNTDKPTDESVSDDPPEDEVADEGYVRRDIRSIAVKTNPFNSTPMPPVCPVAQARPEDVDTSGIDAGQSPPLVNEEKLVAHALLRQVIEREVETRTNEMVPLIRKAEELLSRRDDIDNKKIDHEKELDALNDQLMDRFADRTSASILQSDELDDKPAKSKRTDYLLVNPHRFTGQNEIGGTLSYFSQTPRTKSDIHDLIVGLHNDLTNLADYLNLQIALKAFLAKATQAGKPTLGILHATNHWMLVVVDARDDPPVYYLCDTNAPDEGKRDAVKVSAYFNRIWQLSDGQINENNRVYCGYPMQKGTSNACGPLACWILGRIAEKLEMEPKRRIDDLFQECFVEWCDMTKQSQELEREFARRQRARMFAQMEAWSTSNQQSLSYATCINAINFA